MQPALAGVNVAGYLRSRTGVGTVSRRYVRALRALGAPVALKDLSELNPVGVELSEARFDAEHPHPVNLICVNAVEHPAFAWYVGEPFLRDKYNIGVWFWELPAFPSEWCDRFVHYDELWAPTAFIANTLAPISPVPVVRIPVVLTPDTTQSPGARDRGRQRLGANADEYVYLFVFDFMSYMERKNPIGLIDAFRAAFAPDVHARLVIKCVNGDFNPRGLALLRERAAGYPIDVIDGYRPAQEMDDLVAACDAFVSLHRSEGLGLTMAEAMAAGKPVAATGWSGNTEFMNVSNSFPIRYQLVELEQAIGPYQAGSVWAEPSVEHAAEMLKLLFDDRELGAERGDLARRTLYEDFSAEHVGKLIGTRLQVVADRREAQRSMIEALTHPATEPPVPRAPEVPAMDLQSSIYGWPGRIAKRGVAFFLSYHTLFQRQINQQFASFMRELESVQNRHGERLDEHDRRLDGVTNELQQMRDDFAGALRAETVTRGERAYLPLFGDCESIIVLGVDGCELMQILLDSGASAVCVESDARLVARARARGIPIVNADALAFLASADERVDAIFSTLPLGMLGRTELADFLMNAQNRLRRGGCLVAETEEPDPDILVNLCFQAGFASARIAHSTVRRYALIAAMAPNDLPNHK